MVRKLSIQTVPCGRGDGRCLKLFKQARLHSEMSSDSTRLPWSGAISVCIHFQGVHQLPERHMPSRLQTASSSFTAEMSVRRWTFGHCKHQCFDEWPRMGLALRAVSALTCIHLHKT